MVLPRESAHAVRLAQLRGLGKASAIAGREETRGESIASALAWLLLADQEGDEVHELLEREPLLQPFGHDALGGGLAFLDVGLGDDMLLALVVGQGQIDAGLL